MAKAAQFQSSAGCQIHRLKDMTHHLKREREKQNENELQPQIISNA